MSKIYDTAEAAGEDGMKVWEDLKDLGFTGWSVYVYNMRGYKPWDEWGFTLKLNETHKINYVVHLSQWRCDAFTPDRVQQFHGYGDTPHGAMQQCTANVRTAIRTLEGLT